MKLFPDGSDTLMQEPDSMIPIDDETVKVLKLSHHDKVPDYIGIFGIGIPAMERSRLSDIARFKAP